MKKVRGVIIHVAPEFRAKIKSEAATKSYSIIEYSRLLSKKPALLENENSESLLGRKRGFKFEI